jgi:hypothetical protein
MSPQKGSYIEQKPVFIKDDLRPDNVKLTRCDVCKKTVPEKELSKHKASECVDSLIPCDICNQSIPIHLFVAHHENCQITKSSNEDKIPCEICGKSISDNAYTKHLEDCEKSYAEAKKKQKQETFNYADFVADDESEEDILNHIRMQEQPNTQSTQSQPRQSDTRQQIPR